MGFPGDFVGLWFFPPVESFVNLLWLWDGLSNVPWTSLLKLKGAVILPFSS